WECQQVLFKETARTGCDDKIRIEEDQWKQRLAESVTYFNEVDFTQLMMTYCKRELTKTSDRLAAIEAIAREYQNFRGQKYSAGLLIDNVATGLFWFPTG